MQFYGKAESVAGRILEAFRTGKVPQAIAPIFIRRADDVPCRKWSWSNQLLTALAGFDDARSYLEWQKVGRQVQKGEKGFYILEPCKRKVADTDRDTGEDRSRTVLYGFKVGVRFGHEQTDGETLPGREQERQFIDELPLIGVARKWNLSVKTYNGQTGRALGSCDHRFYPLYSISGSQRCSTRTGYCDPSGCFRVSSSRYRGSVSNAVMIFAETSPGDAPNAAPKYLPFNGHHNTDAARRDLQRVGCSELLGIDELVELGRYFESFRHMDS